MFIHLGTQSPRRVQADLDEWCAVSSGLGWSQTAKLLALAGVGTATAASARKVVMRAVCPNKRLESSRGWSKNPEKFRV